MKRKMIIYLYNYSYYQTYPNLAFIKLQLLSISKNTKENERKILLW